MREAAANYRAPSRSQAEQVFRRWAERWRESRPRAVASLERHLEELLRFFAVPAAHWKRVRTTNVIEQSFRGCVVERAPSPALPIRRAAIESSIGVISHSNRSWGRKPLRQFTQDT